MRRLIKKGLLGVGIGAAVMFALFGTRAVYLTRYYADRVRETARANVPFEADVQVAREQVKALDPAIHRGIETLAKLEVDIKAVRGQIVALEDQMARSATRVGELRSTLDDKNVQRVGFGGQSPEVTELNLQSQIDGYRRAKMILGEKQNELEHRQVQYQRLYDSLGEMKARKDALLSKIQEIEARHDAMEVAGDLEDYRIDTNPLTEAERAVAELEARIGLDARTHELQAEFFDTNTRGASVEPGRDVRQEADALLEDLGHSHSEL